MTNTKLRALIIEDEPLAAEMLKALLIEFCSDKVEVITIARDYKQALRSIMNFRPDLLFLDIELPYGKTGFDVLEAVDPQDRTFSIICTTGHEQYALKALKEGVIDYLIKIIDIDELQEAVNRAWLDRQKTNALLQQQKNALLLDVIHSEQTNRPKTVLYYKGTYQSVDLQDIIYCESELKYTRFYINGLGEHVRVLKKLSYFEEYFTQNGFLRVSRSALVNTRYITSYECSTSAGCDNILLLKNCYRISTSKLRHKEILQVLDKNY